MIWGVGRRKGRQCEEWRQLAEMKRGREFDHEEYQ
jgi:hypothetical protein